MAAKAIVLESGTYQTRAGFALDNEAKVVRPTLVGQNHPIQQGVVTNWDDLEKLWGSVLMKDLGVNPEEQSVLVLDQPILDKAARQKMTEILMEKLNVSRFFIGINAVMTLYAAGRLAGVVLETGESGLHAVPVDEGFAVPNAITKWEFGGSGQTQYLNKLLKEKGHDLTADTVRDIKEKLCYVAKNYKLEMAKSDDSGFEKTYDLPDGKKISLGTELVNTGEVMFQPSLNGMSSAGVTSLLSEAVSKFDSEKQKVLKKNIVLGGGPSMMQGFEERLTKEAKSVMGEGADVVASPKRLHSAFYGGSILAGLEDFQKMWVTRAEYKEKGMEVVHEKCK